MATSRRTLFVVLGSIAALILIAIVSIPLFLNADSFRTRIEGTLSKTLGRKVSIGKLDLSVWSGGMVAENTTIADDPKFSTQPFVQAQSVKIRVQMLPLIFHRTVLIKGEIPSASSPPHGCRFSTRCSYRIAGTCDVRPAPVQEFASSHRIACHLPREQLLSMRPVFEETTP